MDIQTMLITIAGFLGTFVLPFIIALIVLFFIINVTRYFVLQSGSDSGREKARRYMLWSIIGFVIVIAIWGIVNLALTTLGIPAAQPIICPDYDPTCTP